MCIVRPVMSQSDGISIEKKRMRILFPAIILVSLPAIACGSSSPSPVVEGTPAKGGTPSASGGTAPQGGGGSSAVAAPSTGGTSVTAGNLGTTGGAQSAAGSQSTGGSPGGATASGGNGGAAGSNGGATAGAAGGTTLGCKSGPETIFCEDFESYATGPAVAANGWKPVTSDGTLTIDAGHAQGKSALHVHTTNNGKAYIEVSPFAPPGNSFYGRMRVWATAFPTAPDYAHYTLVETKGNGEGVIRPIGGQFIPDKSNFWGPGSDGGPTGDWTNWKESAKSEAGKWVCMEWQLASANNEIKIWIDGEAKTELTVSTKTHTGTQGQDFVFPQFSSIWFGWWLYQSGTTPPEFDVWLDDIALSTQRLGCSP